MMEEAPSSGTLRPGEKWVRVDSGSGVDGLDAQVDAPEAPTEEAADPVRCTTANGGEMVADRVVPLTVELDGQRIDIPFDDLPLTMPILSMRRHIHRGQRCRVDLGGGCFRNKATRKKSRLIENDAVYFMRMKIMGSNSDGKPADFARQDARRKATAAP